GIEWERCASLPFVIHSGPPRPNWAFAACVPARKQNERSAIEKAGFRLIQKPRDRLLLYSETVQNTVVGSDIDAAVRHRNSAPVVPRRDLVAARPEFFAGLRIEGVQDGVRRARHAPLLRVGESNIGSGLVCILAASVREYDTVGDNRRLSAIHVAR